MDKEMYLKTRDASINKKNQDKKGHIATRIKKHNASRFFRQHPEKTPLPFSAKPC